MGSTSCLPWKLVFSRIFAIAGLCFFACSAKHHVFYIRARTGSTHVPALNLSYEMSCAWIYASSEECRPHNLAEACTLPEETSECDGQIPANSLDLERLASEVRLIK